VSEPAEVDVILGDVPYICSSSFCLAQPPEDGCGKAAVVIIKSSIALGASPFSGENKTGMYEECWKAIAKQLPWLRGNG
jgi:hypothetical protein